MHEFCVYSFNVKYNVQNHLKREVVNIGEERFIFFNIPGYLSDDIERVQRRALRIILPELSYNDARELINIPSLKERREILCEQFFLRDENLQKLDEFLPNKSSSVYDTRGNCKYNNYYCKTERFRKSFLPQIISKLNCK